MASSASLSQVEQALRYSPIPALRELSVAENDREVLISGAVTTYYLKQLAQETVLPLIGDRELLNQVQVVRE